MNITITNWSNENSPATIASLLEVYGEGLFDNVEIGKVIKFNNPELDKPFEVTRLSEDELGIKFLPLKEEK
jgi:hypothetical protein